VITTEIAEIHLGQDGLAEQPTRVTLFQTKTGIEQHPQPLRRQYLIRPRISHVPDGCRHILQVTMPMIGMIEND
jgi:hypothetical protein